MSDLDVHLAAIAAGDADAFGRWLAGAEEPLRRGLRSFAASVDVEAVLQEAMLRVWQVAPRVVGDGRSDALLRFAHRVARNLAIDEARRLRAAPVEAAELERMTDPVAPILPDPSLRAALGRCRERLPNAPRTAFDARLAAEGGAGDRELAERCGMQLNTFLKNVGRARALLVDCLARAGIGLEVA